MTKKPTDVDVSTVWWLGTDGPEHYDFAKLYGNQNPVELDLGCGKGLFLFNQSRLRPDVNFIGIDWSKQFSRLGASRIVRHNIPNVRIVAADAWNLFARFPDQCFQAIHVYFPDPWWKKRHRKRRIVRAELIEHVRRLLKPDGTLFIATDVEEYFGVMLEVLGASPHLIRLPDPTPSQGANELDYLTHFERKYRKVGKPIFRAAYALNPSPLVPAERVSDLSTTEK
jgi:tRNA (guanine-N7-)-methyltransferase